MKIAELPSQDRIPGHPGLGLPTLTSQLDELAESPLRRAARNSYTPAESSFTLPWERATSSGLRDERRRN